MPGSEMLAQSIPAEEKSPDYVRLGGTSSLSLRESVPETAVVMTVPCASVGHCLWGHHRAPWYLGSFIALVTEERESWFLRGKFEEVGEAKVTLQPGVAGAGTVRTLQLVGQWSLSPWLGS